MIYFIGEVVVWGTVVMCVLGGAVGLWIGISEANEDARAERAHEAAVRARRKELGL